MGGYLPEGQVLSHDLIEGAIARCAVVTDITVVEEAPFHADVAASRDASLDRGDWQLLPILLQPSRYPLRPLNRWKILDNLRRSLVAPASFALLLLSLAGTAMPPGVAMALVVAALCAGSFVGAVAGFSTGRRDLARQHFYWRALVDSARTLGGAGWLFAQLLQQAMLSLDAIVRALYRTFVSHRQLLQWTTAASAQARVRSPVWQDCVGSIGMCRRWRFAFWAH